MTSRILKATLAGLSLAALLTTTAWADDSTTTASPSPSASSSANPKAAAKAAKKAQRGCPAGFDAGDAAGVRVCHTKDGGWRLETTDPARAGNHEYTGTLTTDGKFTDVHLVRPEDDDSASIDGEGKLVYDFKTFSGIDGVAFRVTDEAKEITFDLKVDGQQLPPSRVWVGKKGKHPKNDPFQLHAHKHHKTAEAEPAAA